MNKELLLKNIEKCLDLLSSTTNWIMGWIIVIIFSIASKGNGNVTLLGADIMVEYAGTAMFLIITALTYYFSKLTRSLFFFYEELPDGDKPEAKAIMESHLWICNPFSRSRKEGTSFTDDVGFALFTLLWWLGLILASKLSLEGKVDKPVFFLAAGIMLVYFYIGVNLGLYYFDKNKSHFHNAKRARYTWIALILGITSFCWFVIKSILDPGC